RAGSVAALDRLAEERGIALERDVPLGPLTTLRVGGPAERMATARAVDELVATLELARSAGVPVGVLGKGSDIVVADDGVRGLVIRNRADTIEIEGSVVRADSGTAMAALVKRCTASGLAGIEFGISIPGSLGGAVWANAGAHGGEMGGIVVSVEAWSPDAGRTTLDNATCAFAYRDSRFKASSEIVLGASLSLETGEADEIASRVAAHQAQRRATQPLADQNAGSVFRNPPGDHAGRLIDAAGLKGFRIGSAEVSSLHANFIVVDRGGSASDVRSVGDHVRAAVADAHGVQLEYEIEFVGDWESTQGWATPTARLAGA
ncbi:MAG TPA: UDP-N-acetylmuramate dehydrogenase, partial [Candidatus Limnocylindria bacterium]